MLTFQICTLKPSDYKVTFTASTFGEALKRMWKITNELGEDVVLYCYHKGTFLKMTDTKIYKSEVQNKIENYTTCILERTQY